MEGHLFLKSIVILKGVTIDIQVKISFFKEYNEQENHKKEKIYEQFFYFIGLLSLQTSFVGYYFLNLPKFEINILWIFFASLLFISVSIFLYVYITSIINFLNKGIYAYLPEPDLIQQYIENLENSDNTEEEKKRQFDNFLLNKNIEITSKNTKINIIRQQTVVNIRAALVFNIFILTIAFVPYFILSANKLNSHKVIILDDNKTLKNNNLNTYQLNIENLTINYDMIKYHKTKEHNMSDNENQQINTNDELSVAIKKPQIIAQPNIRLVSESFEPTPEPQIIQQPEIREGMESADFTSLHKLIEE